MSYQKRQAKRPFVLNITMKFISSLDNPILKQVKKLQRRKDRDQHGCYLIEGFHLTTEALNNIEDLELTLIRESIIDGEESKEVESLIGRLEGAGIQVFKVSNHAFDRVADTETPQGLLSVVKRKEWTSKKFFTNNDRLGTSNVVVLDRLQDPGNVGTILRTADGADFLGAIILKGTADVYGPKIVRSAAGSLFRLPLLFMDSPKEAIELIHQYGKHLIVAAPHCEQYYFEQQLRENIALVVGNEGGGVSDLFLEQADVQVKIPMRNSVESLNVAVAAGILMYETIRQKNMI
ncbi:MAG: RNA methyltransferase [Eubacteriales bacterium]|nr:RNA methyltransferase [Eubacteriales bacterium]MDD4582969.1 RNA methyltransferase [Eubacteriales bacterium]